MNEQKKVQKSSENRNVLYRRIRKGLSHAGAIFKTNIIFWCWRRRAEKNKKHVLIIGAGALGAANAEAIVRAGVGKVTIADVIM